MSQNSRLVRVVTTTVPSNCSIFQTETRSRQETTARKSIQTIQNQSEKALI